jgi:hypothetical protein
VSAFQEVYAHLLAHVLNQHDRSFSCVPTTLTASPMTATQ